MNLRKGFWVRSKHNSRQEGILTEIQVQQQHCEATRARLLKVQVQSDELMPEIEIWDIELEIYTRIGYVNWS